jgi:TonB-linked SusC/RagA family outer membrane protein
MKKKLLFSLFIICGWVLSLQAQKTVTGKITNEANEPVVGASIAEKGTSNGAVSDIDGNFSIKTSDNATLIISFVGYAAKEIPVGTQSVIDVSLAESNLRLDDVVVVGYGQQKKATLTGSVNQFKTEDLTHRQVSSTSQLLQGIAPGVSVWQSSGKPGADGTNIRIRGTGSIFSGTGPLIIIDGVVSSMDFLDPNAIESMTILKDAASTSIYGVRASNGVVLIKTKRSAKNGVKIAYNNFFTKQVATNIPEKASAIEHMELSNLAQQNSTGNPAAVVFPLSLIDRYKTTPANNLDVFDSQWLDLIFSNSGLMQNHNITLDAGGDRASLFTSVTFLDQQGLIANNSFKKLDIRMNPDIKITDKLNLSGVFFFNQGNRVEPAGGSPEFIIRQAIGLSPSFAAKFGDKQYGNAGQSNNRNPLGQAESSGTTRTISPSILGKAQLNYQPIKGLDFEVSFAREQWQPNTKRFQTNYDLYSPNLAGQTWDFVGKYPGTNALSESYSFNYRNTFLGQASYQYKTDNHDARIMGGYQTEEFANRSLGASRTNFVNEALPYISLGGENRDNNGGVTETALIGYYGRFNYGFQDKYLVEVNGRYDGTSRFSQALNKQWAFFPSASLAWVFTKENFMKSASFLDFGKIRGSWGTLGNQTLPDNYPFAATYTSGTNYYFNNITNSGFSLTEAINAGIGWEQSTQTNVGLDLSFMSGKLNVTAEYYVKSINDLLFRKPIPAYVGLSPAYLNLGSMENKGWELSINYRNRIGKFKYDITGLLADVQNKVTSLPGVPNLDEGLLRSQEGFPLRSYYGYKAIGYFQSAEDVTTAPTHFFVAKPGDIRYSDLNGDGKVNADDRTFIGNNFPRYEYSFNLNLEYGIFDLNAFVQGVGKKENYISGTGAWPFHAADFIPSLLAVHKDSWTPNNPNATFPRLLPTIGVNGSNSSFWVKNSAYLRLKNVNLGVRIPTSIAKKAGIERARLYVSGQNLFTNTKFWKGFDPEINNNNAEFYPLMKTYTVGINVNFK